MTPDADGPDWTVERIRALVTQPGETRTPCQVHDAETWFSARQDETALACRLCRLCSQRQACLDGAVLRREHAGVWGGYPFTAGRIVAEDDEQPKVTTPTPATPAKPVKSKYRLSAGQVPAELFVGRITRRGIRVVELSRLSGVSRDTITSLMSGARHVLMRKTAIAIDEAIARWDRGERMPPERPPGRRPSRPPVPGQQPSTPELPPADQPDEGGSTAAA